jgi:hypothetical protein
LFTGNGIEETAMNQRKQIRVTIQQELNQLKAQQSSGKAEE